MKCSLCRTTDKHIHDWSEFFGFSKYGDGIWFDRCEIGGVPGAPTTASGNLRARVGTSRYADGGQSWQFVSGFPDDEKDGSWIKGWGAMRFLCHLLGVRPPSRRLKSEPFLPDQGVLALVVARRLVTGNIPDTWYPVGATLAPRLGITFPVFDKERPYDHLTDGARSFWVDLYRTHLDFGIDPGVKPPDELAER